jgi:DtxR family Mn-dependent transcriptional regulator
MAHTFTEENYLKAIFKLSEKEGTDITTNAIAEKMQTKAASVTDMLKKLADKNLINYVKYQGVSLTETGAAIAINIIRKHRIWETFLVDKLDFKWDEVHVIAEELEHINSPALIEKLNHFLDYPKVDPHGDPIPSMDGKFSHQISHKLSEIGLNLKVTMTGVVDHSNACLQHLDKLGLTLGSILEITEQFGFDKSVTVLLHKNNNYLHLSHEVAKNILVSK